MGEIQVRHSIPLAGSRLRDGIDCMFQYIWPRCYGWVNTSNLPFVDIANLI